MAQQPWIQKIYPIINNVDRLQR